MKQPETEKRNGTLAFNFVLVGFVTVWEQQIVLFVVLLFTYLVTLLGNCLIIAMISLSSQLHTPMYFFLSILSLIDVCSTSVIVPNMLNNLLTENKTISFSGCITQTYFCISFVGTEYFLLAAMAYDRYAAICSPLHYTVVMNPRLCLHLAVGSFLGGFLMSLLHTLLIPRLSFCGSNIINHFFCDLTSLLKLSCTDTYINKLMIFIGGPFSALLPFLIIMLSYGSIITSILRMPSIEKRYKAFSTCSSHLTVVTLLYGSVIILYLRPSSMYSPEKDKVVALIYIVVIPMVNPFVYSLRNNDMKKALRKAFGSKLHHSRILIIS